MARKKEIILADDEKQTNDSNKANKKIFVRASGAESDQKIKKSNGKVKRKLQK